MPIDPLHRRRALALVFGSTFLTLCGYLMLMPLLVLQLADRGVDPVWIGLFGATLWLGVFLMAPYADRIVARLGRRASFVLSAAGPLLGAIGFALTESLLLWFCITLLDGMGAGLRWVLAEATVAEAAPPARRGLYVGLFETMVGATFVIGPLLLQLTGTEGSAGFWLAALLAGLGLLLVLGLPPLPQPSRDDGLHSGPRGLLKVAKTMPVVVLVGFAGGFFESGMAALLPLLGLSLGWAAGSAALLVAASGVGSALFMTPAGHLADRLGLTPVLRACAALTLLASCLLPFSTALPALAWLVALVWGSAGGALYTLVMIDIGHRLQGRALLQGTGVLVLAYTAGGMLAPLTGGWALQAAPGWGLALGAGAVAAVTVALLWRQAPSRPAPSSVGA